MLYSQHLKYKLTSLLQLKQLSSPGVNSDPIQMPHYRNNNGECEVSTYFQMLTSSKNLNLSGSILIHQYILERERERERENSRALIESAGFNHHEISQNSITIARFP